MPMPITPGEAVDFLREWNRDSTPIRATLVTSAGCADVIGIVSEISAISMTVVGNRAQLIIDLRGASFAYQEPREAPPGVRERSEAKYAMALDVILPDANRLGLTQFKEDR